MSVICFGMVYNVILLDGSGREERELGGAGVRTLFAGGSHVPSRDSGARVSCCLEARVPCGGG